MIGLKKRGTRTSARPALEPHPKVNPPHQTSTLQNYPPYKTILLTKVSTLRNYSIYKTVHFTKCVAHEPALVPRWSPNPKSTAHKNCPLYKTVQFTNCPLYKTVHFTKRVSHEPGALVPRGSPTPAPDGRRSESPTGNRLSALLLELGNRFWEIGNRLSELGKRSNGLSAVVGRRSVSEGKSLDESDICVMNDRPAPLRRLPLC